jgi:long-chain acyl-CoA synthetase
MKRVWLESYPEGVPHDIDPSAFPSVWAMVEDAIERYRDRAAFTNMGAKLSFGDLDVMSGRFASWLQHEARIEKGDRVAIMVPNLLQHPVALFGAIRAGAVVVNTNPLYTPRELAHQLRDSGARVIVVLENFAKVLQEAMDGGSAVETVVVSAAGDMLPAPKSWLVNFVVRYVKKAVPRYRLPQSIPFRQALARGSKPLTPVELGRDDLAFLQYTGGTTGVSKGAMLSHGNMVANVEQSKAWISSVFGDDSEGIITALPLYHIFALTANCLTFMCIGGVNHLITNPRDMPGFVRELSRLPFTAITGVNTLFNGLLNAPGFDAIDFSRLKLSLGGGMSVQRAVAERWQEVTGCPLLEAYGLTEASPAVCINPLDAESYTGSIGLPVPSTEVCMRDPDGALVAPGEPGELCVRGPQVMRGYWNRPEATEECLDDDGWLATGDIADMDERGFVRILDRKKDMILVSGFNVYPNEVEQVAASHPGVLEAGVIGVPDDRSGEAVRLVVVKRDPNLSEESLRTHCEAQLAAYKRPKSVVFADELPKSNIGKVVRREVRERFGEPVSGQ